MKKIAWMIGITLSLGLIFFGFAEACDEGCTPGYWKQEQHFDSWNNYSTDNYFNEVFGVDLFDPDITLLEALKLKGGGVNAFARHAVAALLNADSDHVYYKSVGKVMGMVTIAVDLGAYENYKDKFEEWNELGCPLD